MTIESKKAVAIDTKEIMESLCNTCAYRGCTNCPRLVPIRGRNERMKDFPQVKKGIELDNGKILVGSCDWYSRINKQKAKNNGTKFEWDLKQRKFVKVIK